MGSPEFGSKKKKIFNKKSKILDKKLKILSIYSALNESREGDAKLLTLKTIELNDFTFNSQFFNFHYVIK